MKIYRAKACDAATVGVVGVKKSHKFKLGCPTPTIWSTS